MSKQLLIEMKPALDRWYEVNEHLPEPGKLVIGYYEEYKFYYMCYLDPKRGWHQGDGHGIRQVDYWADIPFRMPFPWYKDD